MKVMILVLFFLVVYSNNIMVTKVIDLEYRDIKSDFKTEFKEIHRKLDIIEEYVTNNY